MSVPEGDKKERWQIVLTGNATIISKKPATMSKRQELQTEHSQRPKSRKVLLSKKKQLVFEEAKGNNPHAAKELSNAEEDLLFQQRGSKARRGNGDTRAFNPTAQATNNECCPVFYYKEFKSYRLSRLTWP